MNAASADGQNLLKSVQLLKDCDGVDFVYLGRVVEPPSDALLVAGRSTRNFCFCELTCQSLDV